MFNKIEKPYKYSLRPFDLFVLINYIYLIIRLVNFELPKKQLNLRSKHQKILDMKKITIFIFASILLAQLSFAGGIMTNTNHSASWVRMMVRDASLGLDAVYYNPAGLTFLEDGFFLSLNNQSIMQNKTITSDYSHLLFDKSYEGKVNAPLFPGVFTGYKTGKLVISLGFNPVGGGGSATFDKGLPSFEYPISDLIPMLSAYGADTYGFDPYFEGSSIFWGLQLGASYQINDMFSVFLGGRYVMAKNTYEGYLRNITANIGGGDMTSVSGFFLAQDQSLSDAVAGTGALVAGGAGSYTLAMAEAGGAIDAATRASLEGGLLGMGLTQAMIDAMDINTINGTYTTAYNTMHPTLAAGAALTADQEAEVEQKGTGFTPILGLNIKPNDKINIGIKYEFKTELELENETTTDITTGFDATGVPITMFPDGGKNRQDMPALLTFGVSYKITDKFSTQIGVHHYWDKNANYGRKLPIAVGSAEKIETSNEDLIDANLIEYAIGFEYQVTDKFLASFGYLGTKTGIKEEYQTDLSYSNSSNSIGLGGKYSISEQIDINIGFAYTSYPDSERTLERLDPTDAAGVATVNVKETYGKENMFFGIGVDFKF